jgi:hypothetical protein
MAETRTKSENAKPRRIADIKSFPSKIYRRRRIKPPKAKGARHGLRNSCFEKGSKSWSWKGNWQAGGYRPGAYHVFRIFEPKPRQICATPFRDRVVHHAICNFLTCSHAPAWERGRMSR